MAHSPIRYAYWFAAITVSVLALLSAYSDFSDALVSTTCADSSSLHYYLLRFWLLFRFLLGAAQIPIHLIGLLWYRVTPLDLKAPVLIQKKLGPKPFYQLVNICNVCLVVVIALGLASIRSMRSCEEGTQRYGTLATLITLEYLSVLIWAIVLGARLVAIATGNVKNWFFMNWAQDILTKAETHTTIDSVKKE